MPLRHSCCRETLQILRPAPGLSPHHNHLRGATPILICLRRCLIPPLVAGTLFAQQAPTAAPSSTAGSAPAAPAPPASVFGFRDFAAQAVLDRQFLAVPSAALARQH